MRLLAPLLLAAAPLLAQRPSLGPLARQMVAVDSPVVAIRNVRVIDGTGAPARDAQTLVMANGKISALGPAASTAIPAGAHVIDGTGKSVLPGFVLVHEHMFYPAGGAVYHEFPFSFPRLYLAGGVTTARTGGNMAAYADINLKKQIDAGNVPGPGENAMSFAASRASSRVMRPDVGAISLVLLQPAGDRPRATSPSRRLSLTP